ncbi:uncharacterized protein DUF1338 [Maribacter vaceletii]|uniref:2-oxoadipate dioxygenase/decarboxylase n=1 Tax=Maribacter vaceletii TaxID=1206816 RepID=A0A495ECD5_9FLAO|nr:DUF1338 domain-containing protein [Maribacter vaceletii]RKR14289.1 uncharacterized protein DUF1338 [Maribacter vaceletii]
MNFDKKDGLGNVLEGLFKPYVERVPDVSKITAAMVNNGLIASQDDIVNDHIAFRTLGVPNLGISSFEKIFLHYGYTKEDYFFFEGKKLDAYWYAPPSPEYPRIFISELRVKDLSNNVQEVISKYTKDITEDPVDSLDLNNAKQVGDFFYKSLWQLPSLEDYKTLLKESEYASWVIYNRYYLNHYTISVHELPEAYNTVAKFNAFLESIGVRLNTAGGKIKTSADGLLKQSSTVAEMIDAEFSNNKMSKISGSYVEFAERLPLPEYASIDPSKLTREQRREGFESANADKIFESTFSTQTQKE